MRTILDRFMKISYRGLILIILKSLVIMTLIAYFFYRSIVALVLLFPVGFIFSLKFLKEEELKCLGDRKNQFRDSLVSLSSLLSVGYSMENALIKSVPELESLYGEGSYMALEFRRICHELSINKNIEDAIEDWARRSGDEDVTTFAEVFKFAKRSGGDMVSIMKKTTRIIDEKCEIMNEIKLLVASRKFEQSIMNVIPFIIIAYVDLTMPGILDVLYHNFSGVLIMSLLLLMYLLALWLCDKILDIEV